MFTKIVLSLYAVAATLGLALCILNSQTLECSAVCGCSAGTGCNCFFGAEPTKCKCTGCTCKEAKAKCCCK